LGGWAKKGAENTEEWVVFPNNLQKKGGDGENTDARAEFLLEIK